MSDNRSAPVFGIGLFLSLLVLGVYLLLTRLLNVPVGRFLDWVIGLLTFWWLLIVLTVPWNIYFKAKQIEVDAAESRQKGIPVDDAKIGFVTQWGRRAIRIAIVLHLVSAVGLFCLSYFRISPVGYVSSVAVLLLTGLRPAVRAYDYLKARLASIGEELRFPRDDVATLKADLAEATGTVKELKEKLDLERPDAWAAMLEARLQQLRQDAARVDALLLDLEARNQLAHENLSRETQSAISQLTADSKFLEHVREIIRFVKTA